MADIHVAAVRALEAGATYRQAADPLSLHRSTALRAWKIFKRRGIDAVQKIRLLPAVGKKKPIDPDYDAKWMANIKAQCIISETGCWLWQRNKNTKGYGCWPYRGKSQGIHRTMYRLHHNLTLKTEQYVLHRCDIRNCCNPDHLFLGTAKVNNWDCALKKRHHLGTKTHCPQGHAYDEENTSWIPSKSGGLARHCKACKRARSLKRYYDNHAEIRARERARRAAKRNTL